MARIILTPRTLILVLMLLLSTILSFSLVTASAGMNLPPRAERTFVFTPGLVYESTWHIYGANNLTAYLDGELAKYTTLTDPYPNGPERDITFKMVLPEKLTPGIHEMEIAVRELPPPGVQIGGYAEVRGTITVIAYYPAPFVVSALGVADAPQGSMTNATLTLTSWSLNSMPDVYADIFLYDINGTLLDQTTTEHVNVPPGNTTMLLVPLSTQNFPPGMYIANATIHNVQPNVTVMTGAPGSPSFRIGTLNFVLSSYSQNLGVNMTNRFSCALTSNWDASLYNLRAYITFNHVTETTATVDSIPKFGEVDLKAYFDTTGWALGPMDGVITLHFSETPGGPDQTMTFPATIALVPEQLPDMAPKPGEVPSSMFGPLLIILAVLVVLLLVAVVVLLVRRPRQPVV